MWFSGMLVAGPSVSFLSGAVLQSHHKWALSLVTSHPSWSNLRCCQDVKFQQPTTNVTCKIWWKSDVLWCARCSWEWWWARRRWLTLLRTWSTLLVPAVPPPSSTASSIRWATTAAATRRACTPASWRACRLYYTRIIYLHPFCAEYPPTWPVVPLLPPILTAEAHHCHSNPGVCMCILLVYVVLPVRG